ncbi:MAG TPA: 30S ribosomal protein S6 [Egibacteraceae bacterium]|nr:30S ribosomal protein S6 [Egibacteraceae bacterium]
MHTYELMIISNGALDENGVTSTVERFTKAITDQGGAVERVDHWGKRQFAYEIEHMNEGYYTVIDFQMPGPGIAELDRQLRITDEVVRHKIIRPSHRIKRAS